jgi:opacity protein-like surface antigen
MGFAVGTDIGFYPHFFRLLDPALEVRYTFGAGMQPTEWTFGGGLRLSKNLRKWRPYGNFGSGYGRINLALLNSPRYPYDDSVIYTAGGGVEYTVKGPFAVKADYEYQIWKVSKYVNNLTPSMYTVGVTYTIPSKAFRSER